MVKALVSHQVATYIYSVFGLTLLLVLSLALRGFSPGTPAFPSPEKPPLPNSEFQFNLEHTFTQVFEKAQVLNVGKKITVHSLQFYKIVFVMINFHSQHQKCQ